MKKTATVVAVFRLGRALGLVQVFRAEGAGQ